MVGLASFSKGPESPFAIKSVVDIISVWRARQRNRHLLQLSAPSRIASLMVRLQQADKQGLIIDYPGEAMVHCIEQAEHVTLEASIEGVLVHFALPQLQLQQTAEGMALKGPLPAYLIRMQRRESFRVQLPVSKPLLCCVSLGERRVMLPIDDISAGGMGLYDDDFLMPKEPGLVLRGCSLDFSSAGSVSFDLRLSYVRTWRQSNGKLRQRLGCAFEGAHSLRAAQQLQRLLGQIERENAALSRGLGGAGWSRR
jgi:c-di-GMP-binding flagellar brake protein YcgR